MNVLIVDDEQLARQRLRHMLSGMGEQVVGEAATGEQALQQTMNSSPDLVLMDIRMPGMDGLEAAGYINQMDNPPAIIFTTAYTDHALAAFEAHAVDYLLKPIKQDSLANAINAAKRLTRAQIQRLRSDEVICANLVGCRRVEYVMNRVAAFRRGALVDEKAGRNAVLRVVGLTQYLAVGRQSRGLRGMRGRRFSRS